MFTNEAVNMEAGFNHEAYERAKVYEKLVRMKDGVASMKPSGNCAVSSAARTEYGLGSGTFARLVSRLERKRDAEKDGGERLGQGLVHERTDAEVADGDEDILPKEV